MLMVVFGAGASFDSWAEYPPQQYRTLQDLSMPYYEVEKQRPPLAAALFQERFSGFFQRYPECLGLFPQLRWAAGSTGIERRLAELVEEAENDPVVRQQMLEMRFYINEAITSTVANWQGTTHGTTNYAVILDRIDRWRRRSHQQVALVTFNYDILLDDAVSTVLPRCEAYSKPCPSTSVDPNTNCSNCMVRPIGPGCYLALIIDRTPCWTPWLTCASIRSL